MYMQDTWKVKPTLTLTLGLRYSLFSPPWEVNGLQVSPTMSLNTWFNERATGMQQGIPSSAAPLISYDWAGPANGKSGFYNWITTTWVHALPWLGLRTVPPDFSAHFSAARARPVSGQDSASSTTASARALPTPSIRMARLVFPPNCPILPISRLPSLLPNHSHEYDSHTDYTGAPIFIQPPSGLSPDLPEQSEYGRFRDYLGVDKHAEDSLLVHH